MTEIKVKLVDQTEWNVKYVEEALIQQTNKRRVTIIFVPNNYTIAEINSACTAENLATITVTGAVNKTITGVTEVESLAWRLSEYDTAANLTLTLIESEDVAE